MNLDRYLKSRCASEFRYHHCFSFKVLAALLQYYALWSSGLNSQRLLLLSFPLSIDQRLLIMPNNETRAPSKSEVESLFSLYNAGDFFGAGSFCRNLLKTYPDSALVSNMLGVIYMAQGKPTAALVAYENTIKKNPYYPDAYNNFGILLNSLGRFGEAIDKFRKAVQLDPDYSDALNNLGATLQNLNQHEQALTHLSRAITLNPNNPLAFFNYANSLKATGKKNAALESYDRAVNLHPSFSLAFNNRGNLLESMARYEESRRSYTRAIELDPGYARAYSNRGVVEKKLGNYPGARRDFGNAVDLDPWRPEEPKEESNFKFRLYINLGDIQMYFKEFEKALATYDRAAEIDPDNLDVAGFKGNAVAALGNLREGLQLRQESFGVVSFDISKGVSIIHGQTK